MQTSQVTNTANVLTAPSAPNKQNESDSGSFGNVLSREVAQRNSASDAPKNKETGKAASPQQPQQPAKAAEAKSPRTSDAKPAKEGKQADKAQAEEETADASALPDELLALVANLNGLNAPAAEAQAAPVAQDAQQPAAAAATALPATVVLPEATQPAADVQTAVAAVPTDSRQAAVTDLKQDNTALQAKSSGNEAKAELPVATATDAAAKAEELNNPVLAGTTSTQASDFKTAMNESLNGITNAMQPVTQQAGLQAVQQQSANTAERLTPRVGTPAWDQALGQKVVWMVAGEQQSASLTLNPPDLGPLQVVLNVSNSQANATFIAAQPEVRQALEAAMPKLRDMLGEAGIQLGQASVNSGTPNQQGGFEQQGSQSARGHGQFGNREPEQADAQVRVTRVQPSSSGLGMVDTFA